MQKQLRHIWARYIITYVSVAVLVMLLLLPIYQIAYRQARDVTLREVEYALQKNINTLERDINAVDLYIDALLSSREVIHLAYLPDTNHYHLALAMQLAKEMLDSVTKYALFVDDIVVSFRDGAYVVSRGKVTARDTYYGMAIAYEHMDRDAYERALFEERAYFFPVQQVKTNYHNHAVPAITRNYYGNTKETTYFAASAVLAERAILPVMLTAVIEESGFLLVEDAFDNRVLAYNEDSFDNAQYTRLQVASDMGGYRVYAGVDNVVFERSAAPVRRMIFLYSLLALGIAIAAAVLFGTRQYRPVRDYLRFAQSQGYIELDEQGGVATLVASSIDKHQYQQRSMVDSIQQLRHRHTEMLLTSLLGGQHVRPEEAILYLSGEPALSGHYCVLRVFVEGEGISLADRHALYAEITSQLEAHFGASYTLFAPAYHAIIAVELEKKEVAYAMLEVMANRLHGYEQMSVSFAASTPHHGLDALADAASEVRLLVRNIHAFPKKQALYRYDHIRAYISGASLSLFRPDDLYTLLQSGSAERVGQYMHVLLRQFAEISLLRPQRAGALFYGIQDVMDGVLHQHGSQVDPMTYDANTRYDEVAAYFSAQVSRVLSLTAQAERTDTRHEIIAFIQESYGRSDLCLSMLADRFHLSEAYISRLIKAQTGATYSEFVEDIRMKRATELLADTSLTIAEIAQQLGYDNQSTFFKAFKRRYHVPPSSFRA